MKLNVKLTADELMNVIDSAVNEAMNRGYEGLEVDELTEDMCHVVDAALSAMGIEIEEEVEEDDFDFDCDGDCEACDDPCPEYTGEESDSIESIDDLIYTLNGKNVVSKDTAEMLLCMVKDAVVNDNRVPDELKGECIEFIFLNFCKDHGIWGVDMDE